MNLRVKIAVASVSLSVLTAAIILGLLTLIGLPADELHKVVLWVSGVSLGLVLFSACAGYFVAIFILRPVLRTVKMVEQLAEGDLTAPVPVSSADEFGRIAGAVKKAQEKYSEVLSVIEQSALYAGGSSEQLKVVSLMLRDQAKDASGQFQMLCSSSEEVGSSVQTMASGAEEMSASIKEISKNLSEVVNVGIEAVKSAGEANGTMKELDKSGAEIGEVTKVITSIAKQTKSADRARRRLCHAIGTLDAADDRLGQVGWLKAGVTYILARESRE